MINDVQKGPVGAAEAAVGVKAEEAVEATEGRLIHLVVMLIEAMVVIYYLRINPMIGPP